MALSPHITPLFARFVASALAAAAIAVPAAQASGSPSGLITENSASQNRVAAAQRAYGPPDPWMYPFMHNGALTSRNSASSPRYGLITENSASQNRLDRIAQQDRLISENAASQNRLAKTTARNAVKPTAVASAPTNGFDWLDAALGAGSTIALTLLATGAAIAVRRRHAGVAAWH